MAASTVGQYLAVRAFIDSYGGLWVDGPYDSLDEALADQADQDHGSTQVHGSSSWDDGRVCALIVEVTA